MIPNLLLSAVCCAFPSTTGQTIQFAPDPAAPYEKVWHTVHVLEIADMRRWVGDVVREVPMDGRMKTDQQLGAIDEIRSMEGGRPLVFRRQYSRGKRQSHVVPNIDKQAETRRREKCLLRGRSAVFTWVPEEQDYGKYYDAEELEEYMLEGLRADLDLLFMLPAGPVEPGQQWNLEASALIDLLGHGGDLPFQALTETDSFLGRAIDSGVGGSMHEAFGAEEQGDVVVTYEGLREQDGRQLAVLKLECLAGFSRDRTRDVIDDTTRIEKEEGIDYRDSQLTLEVTGVGELLWNLEANRAESFVFEANERVYTSVTYRAPLDDAGVLRGQDVTMQGTLKIEVSFGAAKDDDDPDGSSKGE